MVKLGWRTALRIGIDLKPRLFRVQTLSRSGFHHRQAAETPLNLELMRLIDAQFLETLR